MNHPTCGALPTHICMQGQEAKSVGQAAGGWQPGKESMRSHGCLNLDLRQGFRVWGFKTPNPKPQTPNPYAPLGERSILVRIPSQAAFICPINYAASPLWHR